MSAKVGTAEGVTEQALNQHIYTSLDGVISLRGILLKTDNVVDSDVKAQMDCLYQVIDRVNFAVHVNMRVYASMKG